MTTNTGAFLESVFSPERVRRALPAVTLGVSGVAAYGGYVVTAEKDHTLIGRQKWITFDEILLNTSIIAAGVRFFLNLVAKASWKVEPNPRSKNKARAKEYAELVEDIIHDMTSPWVRTVRSAAMYRLHGFHIAEWTSKRREDGVIGFLDIETRPQFTVERWDLDKTGTVFGVVQRSPQDSKEVYLPRAKIIYVVDNSLSDSPEGFGLLRHCVDPARRLQKYYEIEGTGFETDLAGIPIIRAPLEALQKLVDAGTLTAEQRNALILPLQNFIKAHFRGPRSGLLLDSATYKTQDGAESPSSTYQWDADVVKGGTGPHQFIGTAIDRTLREIARILNVEGLLLGQGQGSFALSKDKTNNFALTVDGTLVDLKNTFDKDVIGPIAQLNGWAKEDTPFFQTDQIAMRDVETITSTLTKMAQAGATLAPDDPAINDIRSLVGLPQLDLEKMAVDATLNKPIEVNDEEEVELEPEDEGEESDEEPIEDEEEGEAIEKAQRRVPAGNSSGGQFAGLSGNRQSRDSDRVNAASYEVTNNQELRSFMNEAPYPSLLPGGKQGTTRLQWAEAALAGAGGKKGKMSAVRYVEQIKSAISPGGGIKTRKRLLKAQRRVPAGRSGGGQFAGKNSGEASILDEDGADGLALAEEFNSGRDRSKGGAREEELEAALLSQYPQKMVARDAKGNIVGAMSYEVDFDKGTIFVDHFGSVKSGTGGKMMQGLIDRADEASMSIRLVSSNVASGFYDKLGFKASGRGDLLIREPKE